MECIDKLCLLQFCCLTCKNGAFFRSSAAEYVAAVFTGRASLPSVSDQYAWLAAFEADLKQNGGYETKYHFLGGPPQWEYCRFLAQKSGLLGGSGSSGSDNSSGSIDSGSSVCATVVLVAPDTTMTGPNSITPTTAALRTTHYSTLQHTQYLTMLETLYDDNMEHRVLYPGAQDSYRNRVYTVDRFVCYICMLLICILHYIFHVYYTICCTVCRWYRIPTLIMVILFTAGIISAGQCRKQHNK